jgi:hypothetical protein
MGDCVIVILHQKNVIVYVHQILRVSVVNSQGVVTEKGAQDTETVNFILFLLKEPQTENGNVIVIRAGILKDVADLTIVKKNVVLKIVENTGIVYVMT